MPCFDERDTASWQYEHEWKPKIDSLTDKLCKTLRYLYNNHPEALTGLPPDVLEWMSDHKAWDEKRGEKW